MDWLAKYWWILVIVFLVGVLLNVMKDSSASTIRNFSPTSRLPPHRDFNDKWDDDDDWPKKDQPKK
ncbi:YpfN family protein [Escherichia coli]